MTWTTTGQPTVLYCTRPRTHVHNDRKILLYTTIIQCVLYDEEPQRLWGHHCTRHCTHDCTSRRTKFRSDAKPSATHTPPKQPRPRDVNLNGLHKTHPATSKRHTAHSHIRHPLSSSNQPPLRRISSTDIMPSWIHKTLLLSIMFLAIHMIPQSSAMP